MKRRAILRGIAGVTVATPFLASLGPRIFAQTADPKRMVIFFTPGGVNINNFWPTVDRGPLTTGSMMNRGVEPLTRHAGKLLIPRGLHCAGREGIEINAPPHEIGMASKLTAANLGGGQRHLAQGPSVDYIAGKSIHADGSEPMVLQVGSIVSPDIGWSLDYASWKGRNEGLAGENQPYNVYRRLMNITPGSEPDTMISQRRQSIADVVGEDLATLRRGPLGREDQQRLDDWLDLVRDTETAMPGGRLACSPNAATDIGLVNAVQPFEGLDSEAAGRDNMYKASGEAMIRLAALTLACDQKRVVTIQWGHGGGGTGPTFRWDGMQHDFTHHQLSHRTGRDDISGSDLPGIDRMLSDIDRWYMTQFANFLDLVDGFSETDGTVLDNSVVAYFNELSDGKFHGLNNIPIILAGSCGGYFKQGEVIDCSNNGNYTANNGAPHNRLLTTLLNAVEAKDTNGQPFENFGEFGGSGEVNQLKRS